MKPRMPLGDFLVAYLKRAGVTHIFGLPGDLVLGLFHRFGSARGLEIVTFSHEPAVGFAADGYARSKRRLGVVCVTYGVGGYNVVNPVAGAYAEQIPLLVVSGGQSDVITSDGMVLGLRLPGAHERFEQVLAEHTCPLGPGDVVVLYTDGVTEAMDAGGELFGDSALARIVTAQQDRDAAGIRERVLRDVRAFVGDAAPHDDMTMIILKVTGAGAARRSA